MGIGLALKTSFDGSSQFVPVDRFRDVGVESGTNGPLNIFRAREGRGRNREGALEVWMLSHFPNELMPIHLGRSNVAQDDVSRKIPTTPARVTADARQFGALRVAASLMIVRALKGKGRGLRKGLTVPRAADIFHVPSSPQLFHQMTADRGWSTAQARAWLVRLLSEQLLA